MNFSSQVKREWQLIRTDAWLKALLFWLPVVLALMLWGVFSSGIAHNLPIGFVDLDKSVVSRGLIRYYNASPTLSVQKSYASIQPASKDLRDGTIYALVVIPRSLEKNIILGYSPEVTVFYNSQYILIGKLINSAVVQAQGTYNASLEALKDMKTGVPQQQQALGQAVPIQQQITPLFNANVHYGQFLVSALIPALWQILIISTMVLAFAAESRKKGVLAWLGKQPIRNILSKLLPYTLVFFLQGVIFLVVLYDFLNWPMHGSWTVLFFSQFLLVIACQSVASLFFFATMNVAKAISLVAGFAAPAFAFMGITFPTNEMPMLAQLWRALLPISHYIDIQVREVNYGASILANINSLLALVAFLSLLLVTFFIAKVRLKKYSLEISP